MFQAATLTAKSETAASRAKRKAPKRSAGASFGMFAGGNFFDGFAGGTSATGSASESSSGISGRNSSSSTGRSSAGKVGAAARAGEVRVSGGAEVRGGAGEGARSEVSRSEIGGRGAGAGGGVFSFGVSDGLKLWEDETDEENAGEIAGFVRGASVPAGAAWVCNDFNCARSASTSFINPWISLAEGAGARGAETSEFDSEDFKSSAAARCCEFAGASAELSGSSMPQKSGAGSVNSSST